MAKISFNEFLLTVAPEYRVLMEKPGGKLLKQGCEPVIKEVKSGCTTTYQLEKKTVMSWVFRRTGIWARIYGGNAGKYEEVIAALPTHMQKKVTASCDYKRLIGPDACSDTCVKDLVCSLNEETQKKCRSDGMPLLLTEETAECITGLICAEVAARRLALWQLNR